jgi:membrane protease YdiL (CAAX protease family)
VFTVVFGLFGLFLAFATGALQFKVNAIKMSVLLASIIALIFIVAFGAITTFIKPQSATGSILLLLPAAVSLLFFPSVAVLEEGQWRGIYMALRKLFPGIPFWLIGLGISLGGMAYHQAVAFNLFRGTIFSEPGYFLWIGGSWFFYCLILEFTKNFSASALTHWIWNFVITFQNLRLLGGS